ncbi:MAG: EthD domain-containing protein [Novosphingobium sp.]|nr:EthD domain-containing protein [Novosphingobium sp.]
MADTTHKILLFLKRKPGMSREAFRDYYENHHVPLASKYSQQIARYVRRYVEPQSGPNFPGGEPDFDVITEMWFDDEATFRGTLEYLTTSAMPDDIVADEENLFDRPRSRIAVVTECDSPMG